MSQEPLVTKPASGHWHDAYPELGRGPVSLEDSVCPEFYEKEKAHIFKKSWPEMSYEEIQFWQKSPTKSCPLVWAHQSGRKSLLLGATADYVEGMRIEESRALLARLRDWATQPHYVYHHEWEVGDLLVWSNTGTMHRALPYSFDSGRLMHRTNLAGQESLN